MSHRGIALGGERCTGEASIEYGRGKRLNNRAEIVALGEGSRVWVEMTEMSNPGLAPTEAFELATIVFERTGIGTGGIEGTFFLVFDNEQIKKINGGPISQPLGQDELMTKHLKIGVFECI